MQGVRIIDNVIEVDVVVDGAAAHAAGDVMCQPIELAEITQPNGCAVVVSVVVTDYDDQGADMTAVFLRSPVPVGANNAAMLIPDTYAAEVLGFAAVDSWLNLTNNQIGEATNCGIVLRASPSTPTSVWLTLYSDGTGTYASGHLSVKVGVLRG